MASKGSPFALPFLRSSAGPGFESGARRAGKRTWPFPGAKMARDATVLMTLNKHYLDPKRCIGIQCAVADPPIETRCHINKGSSCRENK